MPAGNFVLRRWALLVPALLVTMGGAARAATVTVILPASRDTSIYSEDPNGSNAKGTNIFAGKTGPSNGNALRRALIAFDVSPIPAGAAIQSAEVKLVCVKVPGNSPGARIFTLNKVTKPWAEGTSSTSLGTAAPATPNDATWTFNVYNTSSWTTPGGDFNSTPSASLSVNGLATYVWGSAQLAADVQGWLANPATNNGWILFGGESDSFTANQFASRELGATGPALTVVYTAPSLFWVGDDTTRGGSGTWTGTGGIAWSGVDADGQIGGEWDPAATAVFGGATTDGVVTVSGTISANKGMLFVQSDYSVGGAGAVINLGGATVGINTITVNSGSAVIDAVLAGGNGMTKAGGGALVLNGDNTCAGVTQLASGDLRGNGSLPNSVVATSATGSVWPGTAVRGSDVPAAGEFFTTGGLDMSAGGKLKIALNTGSATSSQKLVVTGACQLGGTLSLGVPAGSASASVYTVLSSASPITGTFSTILLNGSAVSGSSPVDVQYSANAVTVRINGGVTPVTLANFCARSEGAGVLAEWTCVSEFQNVGFNLYRRGACGGTWVRVNAALIAGRITSPDAKRYAYSDWVPAGVYEYKLESLALSGKLETFGTLAGPVEVDLMNVHAGVSDEWIEGSALSLPMAGDAKRSTALSRLFEGVPRVEAREVRRGDVKMK